MRSSPSLRDQLGVRRYELATFLSYLVWRRKNYLLKLSIDRSLSVFFKECLLLLLLSLKNSSLYFFYHFFRSFSSSAILSSCDAIIFLSMLINYLLSLSPNSLQSPLRIQIINITSPPFKFDQKSSTTVDVSIINSKNKTDHLCLNQLLIIKMLNSYRIKINNFIINFIYEQSMEHLKKKSLSTSKKTTNTHHNNKSELVKVYAAHSNINKNNKKQKAKLTSTQKKRKDTYDYEFPQFSIVFRQNGKSSTFKSCINNNIIHSKVSERKSSAKKKTAHKSYVFDNTTKTKKQQPIKDISLLYYNFKAEAKEQKSPLQQQYLKCVQKVFQALDVFNKGKISQVNLNKWIPEPALYFLGKVFQKIRNERLSIDITVFEKMCSSLFYQTNPEDVQWFIEAMKNIDTLKKSVNYQQNEEHTLSPIQKRVLEQQHIRSSSSKKIQYINMAFEDMIQSIRAKQAETTSKLESVKQKRKSVTFHILQQKNTSHEQKSFYEDQSHKKMDNSIINVSYFDENDASTTPSKKSILKNSNRTREEQRGSKYSIENEFNNVQLGNRAIPSFTFQLPQMVQPNYQNRYLDKHLNQKFEDIYGKYKDKLQHTSQFKENNPASARYESKYTAQYKPKIAVDTQRVTAEQDNKRLDHLRDKIEGFLKNNAEKIQKNKSFYLQSCGNYL